MSESRRRALLLGGIPLGLLLLLCAAWGIDTAVSGDRVVRNVQIDGVAIGGLDRDDLHALAGDLSDTVAIQNVTVKLGDTSIDTRAGELGATVNRDLLIAQALDARRGGFILAQPFRWAGTFFTTNDLEVPYHVDLEVADVATQTLVETSLHRPVEPHLEVTEAGITAIPGADGSTISDGHLTEVLQAALDAGSPYVISLETVSLPPNADTGAIDAIATEANAATAVSRTFAVLGSTATVEPATLRSWVTLTGLSDDTPSWAINPLVAMPDLQGLFPNLGSDDQQAHFTIRDNKPIIVPPSSSVFCCEADSVDVIRAGLLAGTGTIELAPETTGGEAAVAELEKLGVIEQVSTFTTKHSCCENRVVNIQTMADIVRGHVVMPGERFSLNGFVGKRTLDKGFLPAGAIADGVIEAQVGGGVSQFTTTIFNAVFYAGLDFNEYQSHSLYFSRYPYGREATISYPAPDFSFTNNTPYGVLIWPTYTDSTITVTFYSTKHITVEATGPTKASQGSCTRVTTGRIRTWDDGTVENDSVFAVYRPGEGLDCSGNPTKAATPSTTTTPEDETSSTTGDGETTTTEGEPSTTESVTTTTEATTTTSSE